MFPLSRGRVNWLVKAKGLHSVGMSRLAGLFVQQVSAGLPNGRQDHLRQPILKRLGCARVSPHGEAIQPALSDD